MLTMIVMITSLIYELTSPWVIVLTALGVVWNIGIINTEQAVKGFSNEAVVTVAALFVVVRGVDRPGLLARAAKLCLGTDSSERVALMRFCGLVFVAGGFMNNTPLVALLMPIIRDWARSRDFAPSKFLMPMAYSSICGGYICIMGASTHLMINGMLKDATGEHFGFFAPLPLGLCGAFIGMWYLMTIGIKLLPAHRGGLFRTLKEKTSDMVTELQIMPDCPLIGGNIYEVLDALSIPRGALLKVLREPAEDKSTRARARTPESRFMPRIRSSDVPLGVSLDQGSPSPASSVPGDGTPLTPPEDPEQGASYGDRTRRYWGTFPRSRRQRANTEPIVTGGSGARSKTATKREKRGRSKARKGLEIFPVPTHEVLEGGDILYLSLPQQDCIALAASEHVATLMKDLKAAKEEPQSESVEEEAKVEVSLELNTSLQVCDVDLLEVPGSNSEFLELVVSRTNPFVGKALEGEVRREFEKRYSVAILAIRNNWAESDHFQSRVFSRQEEFQRVVLERASESSEIEREEQAMRGLRQPPLGPGDAILVLTRLEDFTRAARGRDFLATTAVAQTVDDSPGYFDYIPPVLFVVALVLVSVNILSMAQGMIGLMIIYLLCGFVDPGQVTDCVDWTMLILMGSALGMATAVQESGLSWKVAHALEAMEMGRHGTVFVLFLFTMSMSELVTNTAAAALSLPLAVDIANEMQLESVKPLAMTVMLASATAFASPISSPATLMVMGPGGYTFVDFLKVGIALDIIYWLTVSSMLPVFYPLK